MNQARRATRQAVQNLEKTIAKEIKTNPKHFLKYANAKTKVRVGIAVLQTGAQDSLATTDTEKAEVLSEFFGNIFSVEDVDNIPEVVCRKGVSKLSTVYFTHDDVLHKLQTLNACKSPDLDGIHPRVLRERTSWQHLSASYSRNHWKPERYPRAGNSPMLYLSSRKEAGNYHRTTDR